jgi:hypothetical protein
MSPLEEAYQSFDTTYEGKKARAKKALLEIVAILNEGDVFSGELWNILAALRGPDTIPSYGIKSETTTNIRGAIGLKEGTCLPAVITYNPVVISDELQTKAKEIAGHHFAQHYLDAAYALLYFGFIDKNGNTVK